MARGAPPPDGDGIDPLVAEFRRNKAREQTTYRARALALLPHVCAHCGRDFEGRRLRELTVHHKDQDPTNNPPDGSNWELLCLYCHDNEHARDLAADAQTGATRARRDDTPGLNRPFAGLDRMLGQEPDAGEPDEPDS